MLHAYYDLYKCPPTYDIVSFLLAIERHRIKIGEDSIEFTFLPGPKGGFRHDGLWPYTIEARENILNQVAIPMVKMLPSVVKINRITDMKARPTKPEQPEMGFMKQIYGMANYVVCYRDGVRPLRPKQDLPYEPKLVTITLREAEHWTPRNSNVAEWEKAAVDMANRGYQVKMIHDTHRADPDDTAAYVLDYRAMLYRSAFCNLFVNNGPAWLAMALNAPVLMVKPTTAGQNNAVTPHFFQRCGVPMGKNIPGAPDHQRIVWVEDTKDEIMKAFDDYISHRQRVDHELASA